MPRPGLPSIIRAVAVSVPLLVAACAGSAESRILPPAPAGSKITSYEECVRAGYPIMRTYPARCAVPGGQTFTEPTANPNWGPAQGGPTVAYGGDRPAGKHEKLCKDQCGDGKCQEIVCMAEGCPCAETHESCPADCKE